MTPWFGGKAQIAYLVWHSLGDVPNYIEPFYGGGAVHLSRPHVLTPSHVERINDADGFVCNFWRAVSWFPDEVAYWANWPIHECDLHARHAYLTEARAELTARLEGNPDFCDTKIAGWWVWCLSCWIGGEFASGRGPWTRHGGKLIKMNESDPGITRKRPHLGNKGTGVHRQRPHLGNKGTGVHRQRDRLGDKGTDLREYMRQLQTRFQDVDVVCGDWSRLTSKAVTTNIGLTGVFLDPPYELGLRDNVYSIDQPGLSTEVREWSVQNGENPLMRIVLCGYECEHEMPGHWRKIEWKARGGYGLQGNARARGNAARERLWLSPHCLPTEMEAQYQMTLWENGAKLPK